MILSNKTWKRERIPKYMSTILKNSVVPVKENIEHRNESDNKGHILNIMRFNNLVGKELLRNGRRE